MGERGESARCRNGDLAICKNAASGAVVTFFGKRLDSSLAKFVTTETEGWLSLSESADDVVKIEQVEHLRDD